MINLLIGIVIGFLIGAFWVAYNLTAEPKQEPYDTHGLHIKQAYESND